MSNYSTFPTFMRKKRSRQSEEDKDPILSHLHKSFRKLKDQTLSRGWLGRLLTRSSFRGFRLVNLRIALPHVSSLFLLSHLLLCLLPNFSCCLGDFVEGSGDPWSTGQDVTVFHDGWTSIANCLLSSCEGSLGFFRNLELLVHFPNFVFHQGCAHADFVGEADFLIQRYDFCRGSGGELVPLIEGLCLVECVFPQNEALG